MTRKGTDERNPQLGLFPLLVNEHRAGGAVGRAEEKPPLMFEDLCDLLDSDYAEKGRSSRAALKVRFRHLRPFFASFKVAEITRDMIERYWDSRLGEFHYKLPPKRTSPQSVGLELACLRRAFLLAHDRGLLSQMPTFPAPPPKKPSRRRCDFIDPLTFEAIHAGMPRDLRREAISFLYFSCWLPSWMYALRWCDVNFSERLIEFSPGGRTGIRTGCPLTVPRSCTG